MKNWLQCLTIKAVIEWKHEKISCENGNVVPHEVQLQAYCWRNEGLADELSKKKERKEGKSNTQVKVWHMGIRNVMKHVWRIITCCHMERGKRKCKIRPGNVKGNIFQVGLYASVRIHIGELTQRRREWKRRPKKCQSLLYGPLNMPKCKRFLLELNSCGLYPPSERETIIRRRMFTSSAKRSIRRLHVVVLQWTS